MIVTADHECGGFSIIDKDKLTNAEAAAPPANQAGTSSTQTPVREEGGDLDPARSVGPVNGSGSGNPTNFAPATLRTADDPDSVQNGDEDASLWLTYLSGEHTGQDVPLFVYGPAADSFIGRNDNTNLYTEMYEALSGLS